MFLGISQPRRKNQLLSSPRSSSLNGLIFPRSAPKACLINSLRCCFTSSSTVSSKLLVFRLLCNEDSFLAVCFETLTVVDSISYTIWYTGIYEYQKGHVARQKEVFLNIPNDLGENYRGSNS